MTELMVRAAAAAVTAALLGAVVRRGAPELALLLSLAAGLWVLGAAAQALGAAAGVVGELAALAGLDRSVLEPVGKTVVIALVTRLAGEICRSAGEGGLAAFVDTAGTALALGAALPLVRGVLELMGELML